MEVEILEEHGHENALRGMAYSYKDRAVPIKEWWTPKRYAKSHTIANALVHKGGGHNKFLESIVVWIDVEATRDFWSQMDAYRIGTTKQSESTMHTLSKRDLTIDDFEEGSVDLSYIHYLNTVKQTLPLHQFKKKLPEGFLQRRLICTNYKVLQNIIQQRMSHKLPEWQTFCNEVIDQLEYSNYVYQD